MKKIMRKLAALLICIIIAAMAGCGQSTVPPSVPTPSDSNVSSTGASVDGNQSEGEVPFPDSKVVLSMGTGNAGGGLYIYCGGVASVVNANTQNIEVLFEATQGSGANVELLRNGEVDIMICTADIAVEAMQGIGDYKDQEPFSNLRAIIPCYSNKWFLVTVNDKYKQIADLGGKRIGVGPYLSGAHLGAQKIYDLLGIDTEFVFTSYSDGIIEVSEGRMDGFNTLTAHPSSPVIELQTTKTINFVRFSKAEIDKILEAMPYYSRDKIPAGTYNDMTEDYETVSTWVDLFTTADLDENLVYHITKAIMENNETMVATTVNAVESIPDNVSNQPMVLHKGAIKYYREIGLDIPDSLIPEEAK